MFLFFTSLLPHGRSLFKSCKYCCTSLLATVFPSSTVPVTACANRHLKFIDSEVSHNPVGTCHTDRLTWVEGGQFCRNLWGFQVPHIFVKCMDLFMYFLARVHSRSNKISLKYCLWGSKEEKNSVYFFKKIGIFRTDTADLLNNSHSYTPAWWLLTYSWCSETEGVKSSWNSELSS